MGIPIDNNFSMSISTTVSVTSLGGEYGSDNLGQY